MPRLDDFRDMIDGTSDEEILKAGQSLLREMMRINEIKLELKNLEENLTNGGKAIFYYFADELDEDELVFATERISGKLSRIERQKAKEVEAKDEMGTMPSQEECDE
jgi:hypothetical protein